MPAQWVGGCERPDCPIQNSRYLPSNPTQVPLDLYGDDPITGRVVDLSDSGMQREAFVVVEVEGRAALMIVPVERILNIP
jgi:hypothetical protein